MKQNIWLPLLTGAALLAGLLTGCGDTASATEPAAESVPAPQSAVEETAPQETEPAALEYAILLQGDAITAENAKVEGTVVTITEAGIYNISGTLDDGQIIVDAKGEDVRLMLSGADITCSASAPIYVKQAEVANIWLEDGTENFVTDGPDYVFAEGEDEPDAAIFSKDDLAIEGEGSLAVRGNYDMGIHGKDSLFLNANVTVDAVGDGVKGKDAVYLADCELTVTAGGDGIQSNNDAEGGDIFIQSGQITVEAQRDGIKAEHSVEITGGAISVTAQEDGLKANNTIGGGQILIEDGEVTIDAQQDGIQSDGDLTITGGTIGISTLGGAANAPEHQGDFFRGPPGWFNDTTAEDETASAKGIKCVYDMAISGGRILIDAYDDALHSDGTVTISGDAEIMIASGDDGMHANDHLTIESGTVNITQSYEGIEAVFIDILGGDIYMKTSDDGMNANGEEMFGPFGSPNATDSLEDAICYLHIAGGHLIVNAAGDGLDSNGYLFVEGGETYVSGPSNSMNGSLDYGSTAQINGGTLMAFGASGMDETFGYSSTQPAIKCTFNTSFTGDSPLALTDSQGNTLVEFQIDEPDKKYNSVVVSCPELTVGETYTLTCGEETVEIELTDLITTVRQTAAGSPETYAYSRGFGPGGGPPPGGPGW